jgi:hypothetical protein
MYSKLEDMAVRPKVLIIAPGDSTGLRVQEELRRAIADAGGYAIRVSDGIRPGAQRADTIMQLIREADVVIADVGRHFPNVLIEVGFAMNNRKRLILLVASDAVIGLPSDLAGFEYLTYDPGDLSGLSRSVEEEISSLSARRSA